MSEKRVLDLDTWSVGQAHVTGGGGTGWQAYQAGGDGHGTGWQAYQAR